MKSNFVFLLSLFFALGCNPKEDGQVPINENKPSSKQVSEGRLEISAPSKVENDAHVLGENEILIGDLIWEKSSQSGLISWAAAKSYCHHQSMRMPSLSEIKSNWRKLNGKDTVWTRTKEESEVGTYWILDLSSGSSETTSQDFLNEVRCVKNK
ncbi:DUF1566 domain-containing protein [Leptospira ognonensis]|uniref:DUF1566 domain-containing protein n=1 Tax=Leptospira ognonensis TaxID=2484945 RepID=A0A4R9K141_9LEPT|nr:DUF1566 domain-containing protein [Leptospira ognonensis]TGL59383.1 DUF1566 domain-containing protein [Leptospira ognonensis]